MSPKRSVIPVTREKNDEHIQILIDQNLSFCQTSMGVKIDDAKQKAGRCHERLDCHIKDDHTEVNDRLFRMDDTEVGKVTILWSERNKVIAVGGILLLAIVVNIIVGLMGGGKIDKSALTQAVKEALPAAVKP